MNIDGAKGKLSYPASEFGGFFPVVVVTQHTFWPKFCRWTAVRNDDVIASDGKI